MRGNFTAAAALAAFNLVACAAEPETTDIVLSAEGFETAAGFLSCLEGQSAVVSAHRGGPVPNFPENAIETFEHTLAQVPALIETDVRETSDGVLVLLHDETVDRTTNGSGPIAEMTLAEARTLRLVDAEGHLTRYQIPTLAEALQAMRGRTILQLDVKRGISLRKVVQVVEAAHAAPHAVVTVYTDNGAIIAAQAGGSVSISAPVDSEDDIAGFAARGLPPERLIAWTGIVDQPLEELYGRVGTQDVSTSGGALGRVDRAAERGDANAYRALEDAGLDIIATARPVQAARQIGLAELGLAVGRCSA